MAIVGGAIFPLLMGLISDRTHSLAVAYSIPLSAYIYIAIYSFVLSSPRASRLETV
jgi:FHS family L-fucose permease-like MFS transporter